VRVQVRSVCVKPSSGPGIEHQQHFPADGLARRAADMQ
jgi:hypothetical protein